MDEYLTMGAIGAMVNGGGRVSSPRVQILGCFKHGASSMNNYQLLISDGCHKTSSVFLSPDLNDKVTSGELSDYSVVQIDHWFVATRSNKDRPKRLLIILDLKTLAKGEELGGIMFGNPVTLKQVEEKPVVIQPITCPVEAAELYELLQEQMAKPPSQLRRLLLRAAFFPLLPMREVYLHAAALPTVEMRALVHRVIAAHAPAWHTYRRRLAKRRLA